MACDTIPIVRNSKVYISGRLMSSVMSRWFLIAAFHEMDEKWINVSELSDTFGIELWDSLYESRTRLTVSERFNTRNRGTISIAQIHQIINQDVDAEDECDQLNIKQVHEVVKSSHPIETVQSGHWAIVHVQQEGYLHYWMLVPTMFLSHVRNNEDVNIAHAEAHPTVSQLATLRGAMIDHIRDGMLRKTIVVRNGSRPVYCFNNKYSYYPIAHMGEQCSRQWVDEGSIQYANKTVCYNFRALISPYWCDTGHVWGYLHAQYQITTQNYQTIGVLLGANEERTLWITKEGNVRSIHHDDVRSGTVKLIGDDNPRTERPSTRFTPSPVKSDVVELVKCTIRDYLYHPDRWGNCDLIKIRSAVKKVNHVIVEDDYDEVEPAVTPKKTAKKTVKKAAKPSTVEDEAKAPIGLPETQPQLTFPDGPAMDPQMLMWMMIARTMRKRKSNKESTK